MNKEDEELFASEFPSGFSWGVATSSYQIEGGWNEDGKGLNVFDEYCRIEPSVIADKSDGNVACDSYHLYKRDIEMLKELGVHFYRFSISWARVLPEGTTKVVNQAGVDYYHNLIDELLANDIEPVITMYHWDTPSALGDKGEWLNREMIGWFADYARFLFETYGSKVKRWITLNEPWIVAWAGYGHKLLPPRIDFLPAAPYLVVHHMLLAHAKAFRLYEREFRSTQNGTITISLNAIWQEPLTPDDAAASYRALTCDFLWIAHPIFSDKGDYPELMKFLMKENAKTEGRCVSRLPVFSPEEIEEIKGSADFLGLNTYHTVLISDVSNPEELKNQRQKDQHIRTKENREEWTYPGDNFVCDTPWGFRKLLNFIRKELGNPPLRITENGCPDLAKDLNDQERITYLRHHLGALQKAVTEDGCNIQAYTAWSLMDNFEWWQGYGPKFGLYSVDFSDPDRRRTAKASAKWYAAFIKSQRSGIVQKNWSDWEKFEASSEWKNKNSENLNVDKTYEYSSGHP